MHITLHPCAKGETLPLCFDAKLSISCHVAQSFAQPSLPVGTRLTHEGKELFTVVGRCLLPPAVSLSSNDMQTHARYAPLLCALEDISQAQTLTLEKTRKDYALAWVTLSDKGSQGEREDKSGPLIGDMIRATLPLCHEQGFLLPDDAPALRTLLLELALGQGYDIICTTGGTGLGPRDVTPEAMLSCIDQRLYGFEQTMMAASLQKTPNAALSRAVVGTIGTSLGINLPGSVKAVRENLEAILPALPHALHKIHGDSTDCGG